MVGILTAFQFTRQWFHNNHWQKNIVWGPRAGFIIYIYLYFYIGKLPWANEGGDCLWGTYMGRNMFSFMRGSCAGLTQKHRPQPLRWLRQQSKTNIHTYIYIYIYICEHVPPSRPQNFPTNQQSNNLIYIFIYTYLYTKDSPAQWPRNTCTMITEYVYRYITYSTCL